MDIITNFFTVRLTWFFRTLSSMRLKHFLEVIIIAIFVYQLLKWIKRSRSWVLLRGLLVILAFGVFAYFLNMPVILWLFSNMLSVIILAVIIIFQPELRRVLEQLGRKGVMGRMFSGIFVNSEDRIKENETTLENIRLAVIEMSKAKTGALIVIEGEVGLREYERTGILMDSIVTSQLLINIFEHNTPLHDGAVIVRDNRIVAATCYLPLTDNLELSKTLGTRHRAGVGISEVSDSLTVIVSEETGEISLAKDGMLERDITADYLKNELMKYSGAGKDDKKDKKGIKKLKDIIKNEKETDQ